VYRYTIPDEYLIYKGQHFQAEWYYTIDGRMPAYEYYLGLIGSVQARLDFMIRHFCDRPYGQMLPTAMYRIEDDDNKIYAFKPHSERFFTFTPAGPVIIVTNAYHKNSQKMTKIGLQRLKYAIKCKADYLQRNKEGTYYARQ
jgi:hypothetical protein